MHKTVQNVPERRTFWPIETGAEAKRASELKQVVQWVNTGRAHLVLVGHLSPGPHLLDHEVPEVTLGLEVGLKRLLPQGTLDLQRRDPQEQELS